MVTFEVYNIELGFYVEFSYAIDRREDNIKFWKWLLGNPNVRNIRSM